MCLQIPTEEKGLIRNKSICWCSCIRPSNAELWRYLYFPFSMGGSWYACVCLVCLDKQMSNFSRIFLLYVFFVDRELRKSYLFLFMQLNSSMIGQRYNVCIAGKRFLILSLSKALGLKRFVTVVLISLSEKKNCCIFHPRQISRGKCYICVLFYRKMIKSSTLCASMDQQNGLS